MPKKYNQSKLTQQKCQPCEGGLKRLSKSEALSLLKELPEWKLSKDKNAILAEWTMKNFISAVDLINKIAHLAEKENHHPDLHLTDYRNLEIALSTHAVGGLSENDFILAAKISRLPKKLKIA